MNLINTATGEIVEPIARAEAERLTTRIRLRLDTIADNYVAVMPLIREAIERGAWSVLGYSGVSEYVSSCFGDALTHLGVEVRREVVRELTAAGMSTRAIAPVVGVDPKTVRNDQRSGGEMSPPDPEPATPAPATSTPWPASRVEDDHRPEPQAAPVPPIAPDPIIGRDGKKYPRKTPEPSTPRRTPLTDSFFRATYDAAKKVESLHRLIGDDRFPQNAEKVAAKHRNDLLRINDLLQQVINALPEKESTE